MKANHRSPITDHLPHAAAALLCALLVLTGCASREGKPAACDPRKLPPDYCESRADGHFCVSYRCIPPAEYRRIQRDVRAGRVTPIEPERSGR